MHQNAESAGAQWSYNLDPRVTRFGRLMRRAHLDELPQLFNILRGEMSFIGPRPERPEFITKLSEAIPLYNYRHTVRPGIAGWAQINFGYGGSLQSSREKLRYDLYYIKNRSLVMDALILLRSLRLFFTQNKDA